MNHIEQMNSIKRLDNIGLDCAVKFKCEIGEAYTLMTSKRREESHQHLEELKHENIQSVWRQITME